MDLTLLREYVTFADYLNVSETARRLHLSQSTLSHHLAALEKDLGVQLIDRGTSLSLTFAGKLLVTRATELLEFHDSVVEEIRQASNTVLDLHISCNNTETAPHQTLVATCYQLCEAHTNCFVHYHESRDSTALSALRDESIDCVAVFVCQIPSDLDAGVVYRKVPALFPNRLVVSLDKTHPLANLPSLHWEDLAGSNYPLADGYFRLWATTTRLTLQEHIPDIKIIPNALEVQSFIRSLRPDQIQLFDESCHQILLTLDTRRRFIPVDEPGAVSECYIAYLPDRVSPALKVLLDYLDTLGG